MERNLIPGLTNTQKIKHLSYTAPDLMKLPVPVWHRNLSTEDILKHMPLKEDGANGLGISSLLKRSDIYSIVSPAINIQSV